MSTDGNFFIPSALQSFTLLLYSISPNRAFPERIISRAALIRSPFSEASLRNFMPKALHALQNGAYNLIVVKLFEMYQVRNFICEYSNGRGFRELCSSTHLITHKRSSTFKNSSRPTCSLITAISARKSSSSLLINSRKRYNDDVLSLRWNEIDCS